MLRGIPLGQLAGGRKTLGRRRRPTGQPRLERPQADHALGRVEWLPPRLRGQRVVGHVVGFLRRRRRMFFDRLDAALAAGQPFDAAQCDKDIRHWEDAWVRETEAYPTPPRGDSVEVSRRLWTKYGEDCRRPDGVASGAESCDAEMANPWAVATRRAVKRRRRCDPPLELERRWEHAMHTTKILLSASLVLGGCLPVFADDPVDSRSEPTAVVNLTGDWAFAYTVDHTRNVPPAEAFKAAMPVPGCWDYQFSRSKAIELWPNARCNPEFRPVAFTGDPDASLPYLGNRLVSPADRRSRRVEGAADHAPSGPRGDGSVGLCERTRSASSLGPLDKLGNIIGTASCIRQAQRVGDRRRQRPHRPPGLRDPRLARPKCGNLRAGRDPGGRLCSNRRSRMYHPTPAN